MSAVPPYSVAFSNVAVIPYQHMPAVVKWADYALGQDRYRVVLLPSSKYADGVIQFKDSVDLAQFKLTWEAQCAKRK